jgi:hypothetical protein
VKRSPVTFLYTNSYDQFVDAIVLRLGTEQVFRFNLDLWSEYTIDIHQNDFLISNPAGKSVGSAETAKFLWRRPRTRSQLFPSTERFPEESYDDEEVAYAMRELWNRMYIEGRAVLVNPFANKFAGKFIQMQLASQYFKVPEWKFVLGTPRCSSNQKCVVKSLVARKVLDNAVLYTSLVKQDELAMAKPWMMQHYVEAQYDITVVVIRDALFAFELSRTDFPHDVVDWRYANFLNHCQQWKTHSLSHQMIGYVKRYMHDIRLHYGRLDFLLADNCYYFLEVNPEGEWNWLDPNNDVSSPHP